MDKEKLAELGLVKVEAYLEQAAEDAAEEARRAKKRKQNAERQARFRERQAQREAAEAPAKDTAPEDLFALELGRRVLQLPPWRAWLVRRLLGA